MSARPKRQATLTNIFPREFNISKSQLYYSLSYNMFKFNIDFFKTD